MGVFQIVLLVSCMLLIQAMKTSEVPQVKEVAKPNFLISSWVDRFGSNINRPDNYKDKYDELLKINEKLEKDYRDQLAQYEHLRDKHEQELRDMNDRQQKEMEDLKRKHEKEINDNVARLEKENSRLNKLHRDQVVATEKANEKYNEELLKSTKLQGKIDKVMQNNTDLEKEIRDLNSEAEKYKMMYGDEVQHGKDNKMEYDKNIAKINDERDHLEKAKNALLSEICSCHLTDLETTIRPKTNARLSGSGKPLSVTEIVQILDLKKLTTCLDGIENKFKMFMF